MLVVMILFLPSASSPAVSFARRFLEAGEQVRGERGDTAFARQIVAKESDFPDARGGLHKSFVVVQASLPMPTIRIMRHTIASTKNDFQTRPPGQVCSKLAKVARQAQIRTPKVETRMKSEFRNPNVRPKVCGEAASRRRGSRLGLRISFGFRSSDFGL